MRRPPHRASFAHLRDDAITLNVGVHLKLHVPPVLRTRASIVRPPFLALPIYLP
jgi:hypothetical protein